MRIPKHVISTLKLTTALPRPYHYKIRGRYRYGRNATLSSDVARLIAWAKRNHAEARIIESNYRDRCAARQGKDIDYIIIELTDPVCLALEKEGCI